MLFYLFLEKGAWFRSLYVYLDVPDDNVFRAISVLVCEKEKFQNQRSRAVD